VQAGFARQFNSLSIPRAAYRLGLASLMLLWGAGSVHDASAENETRTLSFHHTHSGEDLTVTFKREGRYDEEALKTLNHYLRDWRTQDQIVMDRHLFDIIWEVYRDVDGKQPIQIVSAYRSPATNAMLHRRSKGVARFSQHMLGHAMDFFIPGVPLEEIRFAGLRLQRGGVGFYPTSGSPFVHLDTGNIRHWPRMSHQELAKLFPDGRTVYIPSDGVPLKGYELARAEIEKRGDGDDAATIAKPSLFTSLFRSKSNDDEDEDASAAGDVKPAAFVTVTPPAADAVPTPRAKPQIAAALQLASADSQFVQPPKAKPQATADKSEAKPQMAADQTPADQTPADQTPADIVSARGFWGDNPSTPKQATPAQVVAAISSRQALEAADPQPTAGLPAAYQAMAYAPLASPPVDRAAVVTASAPIPRGPRPISLARNLAPATGIDTVATKDAQGDGSQVATSTRLAAATNNDVWMRIVLLAPSATTSMSVTMMGDTDLTLMRTFFVKPQSAITMSFSDDPMMGMDCDHFSGSATTRLQITSFNQRTALLH
jgi:uncharacterized protein YcbK (DUF882 family)